jgi:hypothetical protein
MAVAATTMGGVALAAGTATGSGKSADRRPTTASTTASIATSRTDGIAPPSPAAGGSAAPRPSTAGLCRAYTAGAGTSNGKTLDNSAFASLIKAAGGRDKVPAFCASVLATKPGNGQDRPTTTRSKITRPNSDKPHGKADQRYTRLPASHPGG